MTRIVKFAARGATASLVFATFVVGPRVVYAQTSQSPDHDYWVYVANESSDLVSLVRFGPDGAVEEKTIEVGYHPADIDGAHGVTVSPTGNHWYVSMAHGMPFGQIWQFETGTDRFVDSTTAGLFPATMALTPDGSMLYVANFNLHGDPVPSSVSVMFTPFMSELGKVETCVRPHGGYINSDGSKHYSGCVGSDQLVEISTIEMAVTRRLRLTGDHPELVGDGEHGTYATGPKKCTPTWVTASPGDANLYVTCNARREVLELDPATLEVTRRFPTGAGPYNAKVTPDGRTLVVSLKGNQAVALIDLATGNETRIETTQPVTHGVAVSPDSRYAFISNESVGATPGTVDVIDLATRERVASVKVQYQPGGISFWKMEPHTSRSSRKK